MARSKHTRRTAGSSPSKPREQSPASKPPRFPATAGEKLVCAKSVIQAVLAAHDASADMGNYDIHWPLSLAAELLEQATDQVGIMEDREEARS